MSKHGPKIEVSGYIANEPKLGYTSKGIPAISITVCDTPIADETKDYKDPDRTLGENQWFTASLYGDNAEAAVNTYAKGQLVRISGRLATEKTYYTGKNGGRKSRTDMIIRFPKIEHIQKNQKEEAEKTSQNELTSHGNSTIANNSDSWANWANQHPSIETPTQTPTPQAYQHPAAQPGASMQSQTSSQVSIPQNYQTNHGGYSI